MNSQALTSMVPSTDEHPRVSTGVTGTGTAANPGYDDVRPDPRNNRDANVAPVAPAVTPATPVVPTAATPASTNATPAVKPVDNTVKR